MLSGDAGFTYDGTNLQVGGYVGVGAASLRIVNGGGGLLRVEDGGNGGFQLGNLADTNLYRSAVSTLKTDDLFIAATGIEANDLTSGRVTFATTNGRLTDSANFTFDGTSVVTLAASVSAGVVGVDQGNSSNTADSRVRNIMRVGGASAGDAFTIYGVSAVGDWSIGLDNDAADAFVLSRSTALGTNNALSVSTGLVVTAPTGLEIGDLTSGRVTFATTNGRLTDDAGFTYDGTTISFGDVTQFRQGQDTLFDNDAQAYIFRTGGNPGDFSSEAGHLVLQPRTSAGVGRDIIFGAGDTTAAIRWRVKAAGHFQPEATNTYDIGTASLAVATTYTRGIQPDTGAILNINRSGGATWAQVTTGEVLIGINTKPNVTNTVDLGSSTLAWATTYTRAIQADTSNSLTIDRQDGTAWATLDSGTGRTVIGINTRWADDTELRFGDNEEVAIDWSTVQTNDALVVAIDAGGAAAASGNIIITEIANENVDHLYATSADPRLYIASATTPATDWVSFHHDATNAQIITGSGGLTLAPDSTIINLTSGGALRTGNSGDAYFFDLGDITFRDGNAASSGVVLTVHGNVLPGTTNAHDVGSSTLAWATTYTRAIKADTSQNFAIQRDDGTAWATVTTGGGANVNLDTRMNDNTELRFGTGTDAIALWSTAQTNDGLMLSTAVGSASRSGNIVITELAARNVDHAYAISSDPRLYIASATTPATNWMSFHHDSAVGVITTGAGAVDIKSANDLILVDNVRPHSGATGRIQRQDGTTWATLSSGTGTTSIGIATRVTDNILFSFGSLDDAVMEWDTAETNDALKIATNVGSAAQSGNVIITTEANRNSNHAYGISSDPRLYIASATDEANRYISFYHDASNALIRMGSVGGFAIGTASISNLVMGFGNAGGTANAFTQRISTSGTPILASFTGTAHTGLTENTEAIDIDFDLARTVQWTATVDGGFTTQRAVVVQAPTYAATAAETITNAATFAITDAPQAGTNMTLTNAYALWVQAGVARFDGGVDLGMTAGRVVVTDSTGLTTDAELLYNTSTNTLSVPNIDTASGDLTLAPAGNNVLPGAPGTDVLGSAAAQWANVRTLEVQAGTGSALTISRQDGTAWATLDSGTGVTTLGIQSRNSDDVEFSWGGSGDMVMDWSTAQTNDAFVMGVQVGAAATSGNVILTDFANRAADHAYAISADPRLYIASATTPASNWLSFYHDASQGAVESKGGTLYLNTVDANSIVFATASASHWIIQGATGAMQSAAGTAGIIARQDGTAWATLDSGTGSTTIDVQTDFSGGSPRILDNVQLLIGSSSDATLDWSTSQTNNGVVLSTAVGLAAQSGNVILTADANRNTDHAYGISSDPRLYIASATTPATDWVSFHHDGSNFQLTTGAGDIVVAPAGGNVLSNSTNTITLGAAGNAFVGIYTRLIEADTSQSLAINRQDGTAWATLSSGTGQTTLTINTGLSDDTRLIFGGAADVNAEWDTNQTNDGLMVGITTGAAATSGNIVITDNANLGTDHAYGISSDPRLYIASATTPANNWISLYHDGTTAKIETGVNEQLDLRPSSNTIASFTALATGGVASGFSQRISTSGTPSLARFTGAAHTGLTENTESIDVHFNLNRIVEFISTVDGGFTTQRAVVFDAPTYAATAAETITNAATVAISGAPAPGAFMAITNPYAFWVQGGVTRIDGNLEPGTTNSVALGSGSLAWSDVYTRNLQPDSSQSLTISRQDGTAWATLDSGTSVTAIGIGTRFNDDTRLMLGASTDFLMEWDTGQTNDALILAIAGGSAAQSGNIIITEDSNAATDHAYAASSNPRLYVASTTTPASNWTSLYTDAANGAVLTTGTGGIHLNAQNNIVFVNQIVRPLSGNSLILQRQDGTAWATLDSGTGVTVMGAIGTEFTSSVTMRDDVILYLGTGTDAAMDWSTSQTNHGVVWSIAAGVAAQSGNIIITEEANANADHAYAVSADPRLYIASATTPATDWMSFHHDATSARITTSGAGQLIFNFAGADELGLNSVSLYPATTAGLSLGTGTNAYLTTYTRAVEADTGVALAINRQDGTAWATLDSGTGATVIGIPTSIQTNTTHTDDFELRFGDANDSAIDYSTAQTNDGVMWYIYASGTTARSGNVVLTEFANKDADHAYAASTDPRLYIASATTPASNWVSLHHDGSNARYARGNGFHQFDAQLLGSSGTAAAPQYSFTGDTDTGLWSVGANDLGVAAGTATLTNFRGNVNGVVQVEHTQRANTSGTPTAWKLTGGAHTGLTENTEAIDVHFNLNRIVEFTSTVDGGFTTQRAVVFDAPTYAATAAETITNAATVAISGAPAPGAFMAITNPYAFWVQGGVTRIDGNLESGTTNTVALGTSSLAWSTVYTRNIQPDTGQALILREDGGTAAVTIGTSGQVNVGSSTVADAANEVGFGNGSNFLLYEPAGRVTMGPDQSDSGSWDVIILDTGKIALGSNGTDPTNALEIWDDGVLSFGTSDDSSIEWDTAQTNGGHAWVFRTSLDDFTANASGNVMFTTNAAGDLAIPTQSGHVQLIVTSGTSPGSNYLSFYHDASNAVFESTGGGFVFNESGADTDFRVEGDTLQYMIFTDASAATENIALLTNSAPGWNSMDRGLFIGDMTTAPTGNPTSGLYVYVDSGAGKARGSSGTITTWAPAEPHCPRCGRDYALEWRNDGYHDLPHMAVCVPCMVGALDRAGISRDEYLIPEAA